MWILIVTSILLFILFSQRKQRSLPLRPTLSLIPTLKSPFVSDIFTNIEAEMILKTKDDKIKYIYVYDSYCEFSTKFISNFIFAATLRGDRGIFMKVDIQSCPIFYEKSTIYSVPSILKISSEEEKKFHESFELENILKFIDK